MPFVFPRPRTIPCRIRMVGKKNERDLLGDNEKHQRGLATCRALLVNPNTAWYGRETLAWCQSWLTWSPRTCCFINGFVSKAICTSKYIGSLSVETLSTYVQRHWGTRGYDVKCCSNGTATWFMMEWLDAIATSMFNSTFLVISFTGFSKLIASVDNASILPWEGAPTASRKRMLRSGQAGNRVCTRRLVVYRGSRVPRKNDEREKSIV
jgi:hypothetical protein